MARVKDHVHPSLLDADLATLREAIYLSKPHHGLERDHDDYEWRVDLALEAHKRVEAEIARLTEEQKDRRPSWRTLELVRDIVERGVGPDTTPDEALKTIGNLIEKRHPREGT